MKLNEMKKLALKKREVMDNKEFYLYTYIDVDTKEEVTISKKIPSIKEVAIEGNDNRVVLPVVPDKITIKGDNNEVIIDEEDVLEIPYFMTKEYRFGKK